MRENGNDSLSSKQHRALAALLLEPDVESAAERAGCAASSIYRWLQEPAFEKAYRSERRKVLEVTVAGLVQVSTKALRALERNLECGQPSTEVRAAMAVLDRAIKGQEVYDLAERLERLEEAMEAEDTTPRSRYYR